MIRRNVVQRIVRGVAAAAGGVEAMRTGRTVLATVVLVSGLVAGALQTPAAGRHVAIVSGVRDSSLRASAVQLAIVSGVRDASVPSSQHA